MLFAGLLIPFVLGLYWPKANMPAALAAIAAGVTTRLTLFVFTPTTFGVDNTLLYIPNDVLSSSFDGLPTPHKPAGRPRGLCRGRPRHPEKPRPRTARNPVMLVSNQAAGYVHPGVDGGQAECDLAQNIKKGKAELAFCQKP